ncbi:MAG: hypothetical protein QF442_00745 [Candidatus Peribacteraceae bacterium]|jgi:hypothetical protein|nr:hypothetical protein [Candidatus Peribacteraceae bacterium]
MMLLDALIVILTLLVLGLVIMAVSSIFLSAPYVPTPWKVCSQMVEMANLTGKEVVYDLGAGDGRLLITAKKAHPGITAKGYELAPLVYFWSKFIAWWSEQDIDLRMKNFMHQDLSDADCVFLYLMPGVMKSLEKKFAKELKPGTIIVSHAFYFPDRKPIKKLQVKWLHGKKELRLYKW